MPPIYTAKKPSKLNNKLIKSIFSASTQLKTMQGTVDTTTQAKEHLAGRLNISVADIKVVSVTPGNWANSSLGCPEPDSFYMMALVPGSILLLEANGQQYQYNTSSSGQIKQKDTIGQEGFYSDA